jgi:arylsulfatase A-like enzyme
MIELDRTNDGLDRVFHAVRFHDGHVGTLHKSLADLRIADNTILLHTPGNGPRMNCCPDGALTRFRNETNSNWGWAFRTPCVIRWPGYIPEAAGLGDSTRRGRAVRTDGRYQRPP